MQRRRGGACSPGRNRFDSYSRATVDLVHLGSQFPRSIDLAIKWRLAIDALDRVILHVFGIVLF